MPKRPPVFRPSGWKPRTAWARPASWSDPRKRGRAGQRDRAQVLLEEPFCRHCLAVGRHVQATVVDHILPLEWSRCDERWNKQALCRACHEEKSKRERAEGEPIDIAAQLARLKAEWLGSTT
ncbi:HNH endonuclease signature motif containing protein [Qipengyuania sp. NPDC077410]|uniref:HNH endonuclease signature motif containing protein n=1 Tax=Qipengyuania sp. NPDC077410 TaxID=3364496 RepID=UPI0037C939E6